MRGKCILLTVIIAVGHSKILATRSETFSTSKHPLVPIREVLLFYCKLTWYISAELPLPEKDTFKQI